MPDGFVARPLDLACHAGFLGYFKRANPTWTDHLGCTVEILGTPFPHSLRPGKSNSP